MKKNVTLLVLAAGMGSRYGGLKQIDTFGPKGETILDYSIYDAVQAGFDKVVFVIRESFRTDIEAFFHGKFDGIVETVFVAQEMDDIPAGFTVNPDRQKPWGTAHAVAAARHVIREPFCVINADDFYGREAYQVIADFLSRPHPGDGSDYALVGYDLVNTLSKHGTVNRGVCSMDESGFLNSIVETLKIGYDEKGAIVYPSTKGQVEHLAPQTAVSMNMWGFYPDYFDFFEKSFKNFLTEHGDELRSEFYIPLLIDQLIRSGRKRTAVLHSTASWFGVTYQEDKPFVIERINDLVIQGVYPVNLWP